MRPTTTATDMSAAVAALLAGQARGTGPARTPARPRKKIATADRAIKPTRVNPRARRTP
jgi:hypothetical protein